MDKSPIHHPFLNVSHLNEIKIAGPRLVNGQDTLPSPNLIEILWLSANRKTQSIFWLNNFLGYISLLRKTHQNLLKHFTMLGFFMSSCGFWLQRLSRTDRSCQTQFPSQEHCICFFFQFVPQLDYLATDL